MLALSFLILIGVVLVAEGSGVKMNKGYIYFAMAFSMAVEFLNIRVRRRPSPRVVHNRLRVGGSWSGTRQHASSEHPRSTGRGCPSRALSER